MAKEHWQHFSFEGLLVSDDYFPVVRTPTDDVMVLVLLKDGIEFDDELSYAVLHADHVQKIVAHLDYTSKSVEMRFKVNQASEVFHEKNRRPRTQTDRKGEQSSLN